MLLEVEGVLDVGDDLAEGFTLAAAGGEGAAVDEGGASGELGASHAGEQRGFGDGDAGVDECRGQALAQVFQEVGGLSAGG
ncbi:hypothetical protein [Streptomyces californicus]|uniref:hypothetical protein n=1 Tax=Streptomyces californicus TaxID=67351 RepID=UPI00406BB82D